MAHELVDSDEEIFGSDESDEEDYTPSDTVSESDEVYDSDQSDFDAIEKELVAEAIEDETVLLLSKDGKTQYSFDPPPLGRPVGRSSFSNKGGIIIRPFPVLFKILYV